MKKRPHLNFMGHGELAKRGEANPQFKLRGYSHGSSNHLAQDLAVMLQVAWLMTRYRREEKELMDKARAFEREYDQLNFRDDQFDLSAAALSIALCVLATASLANRRWLLILAWVFGALGILMAVAGLLQLDVHPGWLVRILS